MLRSFDEIMKKAVESPTRNIAVADAAGGSVIEALKEAADKDIVFPILVGNPEKILPIVKEKGLEKYELVEASEPKEIAQKTVELVRNGKAQMVMKGKLSTPVLLKAVLDKEKGLRKSKVLSHVAVAEVKAYNRLMIMTDGGMNIRPDINQKVEMLKNAAWVANGLGIENPKAAALCAIEVVNPDMQETLDAAMLTKMSERGQLGNIYVEGPIAMDVVLSKVAKTAKGLNTELSEETDIFLFPEIASGNITAKSLIYLADAIFGGLIVGATVPIVLLSRSDTAKIKLSSIALAAALDN